MLAIGELLKIFIPTATAFFVGVLLTPVATHFFYKYKMWKKRPRTANTSTDEFKKIHKNKEDSEVSVPCVGGIIIFITILITALIFMLLAKFSNDSMLQRLDFISREQTLIPLFVFIFGAFLGLIDDILEITGRSKVTRDSPWYTKIKLFMVIFCGALVGWWFYTKLGIDSINIPFDGLWYVGALIVPFVVVVMLGTFSGGVIDGLDGLAGGVLAIIFSAYAVIAYTESYFDIATFCGVISGATLAFLWFNIPPARFYMGEVGMMPLTITLATIAFLTDTVLLLIIIAFPLVITSLSSSIQLFSKKFFGKRVFKLAPLHHHFEAIGWPATKVVMRFWIISIVFAIIGIILAVIS